MPPVNAIWLIPWFPVHNGKPDEGLAIELYKEVGPHHILFGIRVRPFGTRQDQDDVLFELLDGSGRYACVHLTFVKKPETDPRWPETEIFQDWDDFARNRMKPDHEEWTA